MQQRQQNSTTHPIPFLLVSSTDHTTGVTGLGSAPVVLLSKDGGAFAAAAGAVSEIGDGWYDLAANATDRNTLGALLIHATGTGADPYDDACEIVGYDPFNSTNLGLSALVTPPTVAQIATQIFTDTTETDFQAPMTPGWILRLLRQMLLGSLPIPMVPAQWRCVLDDNFQHADTTVGSAGSTTGVPTQPLIGELVSWQDINGGVWSISGNTLSNNAHSGSGFTAEFLLRTDSAGRAVNQRMVLNTPTTAGHFGVVLRWVDSNNFYYLAFSAIVPDWTIEKVVAGVPTTLGSSTINAITSGHALEITMQAVGTSPTTLSIQVIDLTAGICVLSFADSTVTDSSGALQISTGVVGLDNGNSNQTNLTRVRGYVGLQTSDAPGWYTAPPAGVNVTQIDGQNAIASGAVTFPAATLASTTNITAGTVTTATNLTNLPAIPANWLTATGIAASALSAIATAVETDVSDTLGADIVAIASATAALLTRIPGVVQPQTGDAYARLGAPVNGSTSADIAAVKTDTATAAGAVADLRKQGSVTAASSASSFTIQLSGAPTFTAATLIGQYLCFTGGAANVNQKWPITGATQAGGTAAIVTFTAPNTFAVTPVVTDTFDLV